MTPMSKKTQGNRRLTSSTDRSTLSHMTGQNATPQLITKDDVLAWFDETKGKKKRSRLNMLWRDYALEPKEVWALIEQQEGYCPICRRVLTLEAGSGRGIAIDHDGESRQGHVRGVLHVKCNILLGFVEDLHGDPDSDPTIDLPREYLDNPPAKNIEVGGSNLYDDKIEDRWKRGRPGRICENPNCEKEIRATAPRGTKYCGPECNRAARTARQREIPPDRKCLECGKPIDDDVNLHQKYCDPKCKREAEKARRRRIPPDRKCLECGKPIDKDANWFRKYCDSKCWRAVKNARRREIPPDRKCLECGKPIDDDVHSNQKYCDLKCRRAAKNARRREIPPDRKCLECGEPIDDDVHLNRTYCDLKCRRAAKKARQAA